MSNFFERFNESFVFYPKYEAHESFITNVKVVSLIFKTKMFLFNTYF